MINLEDVLLNDSNLHVKEFPAGLPDNPDATIKVRMMSDVQRSLYSEKQDSKMLKTMFELGTEVSFFDKNKDLLLKCVVGWSGIKLRDFLNILPMDLNKVKDLLEEEVQFDQTNLVRWLKADRLLCQRILNTASNPVEFQNEDEIERLKKSLPSTSQEKKPTA